MAIPFPGSLKVRRNSAAEKMLVQKAREFIEAGDRTPGIHASDLMDELQAFWKHTVKTTIPDRLVNTFLVGKVLHAFVLQSVDERSSVDLRITDDGSSISDLGFSFSPDKMLRGIVRELKTSRSFYEPKTIYDLDHYIEQVLIYMAAQNLTKGQIWILYLNFRDKKTKQTAPAFRTFDLTITEADLKALRDYLKERAAVLADAIQHNDPSALPLCREWKCGKDKCEFYGKQCKPEGRYGTVKFDGKPEPEPSPSDEPSTTAIEETVLGSTQTPEPGPSKASSVGSKPKRGRPRKTSTPV